MISDSSIDEILVGYSTICGRSGAQFCDVTQEQVWPSNVLIYLNVIESTAAQTLQLQFSGYGSNLSIVMRTLDRLGIKEPSGLWIIFEFPMC